MPVMLFVKMRGNQWKTTGQLFPDEATARLSAPPSATVRIVDADYWRRETEIDDVPNDLARRLRQHWPDAR